MAISDPDRSPKEELVHWFTVYFREAVEAAGGRFEAWDENQMRTIGDLIEKMIQQQIQRAEPQLSSRATVTLWVGPSGAIPPWLAHVEPRKSLSLADMTPCPCGARFREHDWVLTIRDEITVLACSRDGRH